MQQAAAVEKAMESEGPYKDDDQSSQDNGPKVEEGAGCAP